MIQGFGRHLSVPFDHQFPIYVVYLNSVFLPGSGKFDHKFQKVQVHMGMTRGDAIKEYKLILAHYYSTTAAQTRQRKNSFCIS
jgi:hypothetical protein